MRQSHVMQRTFFETGRTLPISFRITQLRALERSIRAHEADLIAALYQDLRKSATEAYAAEIGFVLEEIRHALAHISAWARPRRRGVPPLCWPGRGYVRPEPRGVVLIMGPWNYPFQLLFAPLVGALAAGNAVCLKPSEQAPHVSAVMARIVGDALDPVYVRVEEGGRETAEALLREKFDFIFYTGGTAVGRVVMEHAARNLTPVALELGGKSPCVVCADARLDSAARRIVWGKFLNAGQTCVAPDFVYVDRFVADVFRGELIRALKAFYGPNPQNSPDYGRIINRRRFDRLIAFLRDGTVAHGGEYDAADLYIAPTLLTNIRPDADVMREEIFGPILPLLEFDAMDEVWRSLAAQPTPLAAYLFTRDPRVRHLFLDRTRSGGVCVNDTVKHLLDRELPFGGVGESGMGAYHGKATFDTFTHFRSVLERSAGMDIKLAYPPPRIGLSGLKRIYGFLLGR